MSSPTSCPTTPRCGTRGTSGRQLGPADPTWDYYDRDETGQATHYFHYTHLPNLNLDNPTVRDAMLAAMLHWVNDYGFDGFRQDMAWAPPLRTPDFWVWCNAELRKANPDLLMLAEAPPLGPDGLGDPVGWYQRNGFDITYDWATSSVIRRGTRRGSIRTRGRFWPRHCAVRHPRTAWCCAFSTTTTPAPGSWTGWAWAPRVAAVLMMTVPGVPAIWAGQEIGASYLPYGLSESAVDRPWRTARALPQVDQAAHAGVGTDRGRHAYRRGAGSGAGLRPGGSGGRRFSWC